VTFCRAFFAITADESDRTQKPHTEYLSNVVAEQVADHGADAFTRSVALRALGRPYCRGNFQYV